MHRIVDNGLVYYQFESLLPFAETGKLRHAVFTRLGGVSQPPFATLNTGGTVGDEPAAVAENHRRIYRALDVDPADVATASQVHGVRVTALGLDDRGQVSPRTDALITTESGLPVMQRYADCVPLILYDPVCRALGLAHAGWRGTVGGMAFEAVKAMTETFGTRPADLIAGIGPSIGPCCYEVGPDVTQQVRQRFEAGGDWLLSQNGGTVHLDLWAANCWQLEAAGIERVEVAEICTGCRTDEFFSHRAEKGRTGRFGVLAMLPG